MHPSVFCVYLLIFGMKIAKNPLLTFSEKFATIENK